MLGRAFLTLILLATVACSDDKPNEAGTGSDEESEEEGDPRAQEVAEEAVLALDDLPAGWEKNPPPTEEEQEEEDVLNKNFADCLDIDVSEITGGEVASAESSFSNADDEEVTSEVTVAETEGEMAEHLGRFRDPAAQRCYVEVIQRAITLNLLEGEDDVEVGEITFNEMSFEDVGDDSLAFRLTVPVSDEAFEVELFIDYVLVMKGRVGITTTFQSTFSPFDQDEALRLAELVVDRVPASA